MASAVRACCANVPATVIVLVVLGVNYPAMSSRCPVSLNSPRYHSYLAAVFCCLVCEVLLIASIVRCVRTPAGPVNRAIWHNPEEAEVRPICHTRRESGGGPRYCPFCTHYKPDRAHHCHDCGVCVLKLDHHCIFLNNCVGYRNHKYFVLFLFYAVLNGLCIMWALWAGHRTAKTKGALKDLATLLGCSVGMLLASATAFAAATVLSFLLAFHMYLTATNQTMLDLGEKADWSTGSIVRNLEFTFGRGSRLTWLLPVDPDFSDMPGDQWVLRAPRDVSAGVQV